MSGAVFAEFAFFRFQDAEGFTGEIGAVDIFRVEDIAEFIEGEAIVNCQA